MRGLILGAVAYDPKVVTIWDGFKAFFEENGLPFDYVLFHNYERQVDAQLAGVVDVGWASPLAWIQARRVAERQGRTARAIAMRDTDQDLRSAIVVRTRAPLHTIRDLAGRRVGVGAADSPQATILPLLTLQESGLDVGSELEVVRHDLLLGKHGDHIGGEREAIRALLRGEVDAACVLDGNLLAFAREGTLPPGAVRVLAQTPPYDHCNFTVLDGVDSASEARFMELLLGMSWEDPKVRHLMDLEGLRAWRPGRLHGYAPLERACDIFGTLDAYLDARS